MDTPWLLILMGIVALLSLPIGILILCGAIQMKTTSSYGLALTAAILAIMPIHVGFLIGLPFGIWALVVLTRPDVKAVFTRSSEIGARQALEARGLMPEKVWAQDQPREDVRLRLKTPGTVLFVVSIVHFVAVAGFLAISALRVDFQNQNLSLQFLIGLAIVSGCGFLLGFLLLSGSRHMKSFRSHGMAMTAAIFALLPLSPMWWLSFPFGIWAIVELNSDEVKREFALSSQVPAI